MMLMEAVGAGMHRQVMATPMRGELGKPTAGQGATMTGTPDRDGSMSVASDASAHPYGIQCADSFFDGQVAVVTGAGGGIGRSVARALWSRGAHVCLLGRTQRKLEETAKMVEDESTRFAIAQSGAWTDRIHQLLCGVDRAPRSEPVRGDAA